MLRGAAAISRPFFISPMGLQKQGATVNAITTALLSALAILAFAGNSVLTRLALLQTDISPSAFMVVRLLSGALALAFFVALRHQSVLPRREDQAGILSLFLYAITFTYAYEALGAAAGALILFGVVQLTLSSLSLVQGHRPRVLDVIGMALAFAGLAWLLLPKASAPPLFSAALMVVAGIAWGVYTMSGRNGGDPVARTARNFVGAGVLSIVWLLFTLPPLPDAQGLILASVSGVVTSALGYVIWYMAVPRLSIFTSGALQLLVPIVASLGGLLIGESLPPEWLVAAVLTLGGIALTLKRA
jgi:drug/metabolite transporter (DMT)-like permease